MCISIEAIPKGSLHEQFPAMVALIEMSCLQELPACYAHMVAFLCKCLMILRHWA
ncbi:hypothetical protein KC19_N014200 [Ceratodon purpureus]|nr:hypothetical protein KC19_N014200 [Ceratodon purpureus]